MKIVNFNHVNKNTWKSWNKQYCQDLNNKITSLYDYIIWNYPEYLILNSPDNINAYKSLRWASEEPKLPFNDYFETEITIQEKKYPAFFANRLNFHQGFINLNSTGDGFILLEYNSTKHSTVPVDRIHKIGTKTYVLYDFPSGYVCILNKQTIGLVSESNLEKNDINNYSILPLGNGGYYEITRNGDSIVCRYEDNDFKRFVNSIVISLAQNSRYIIPRSINMFKDNNLEYTIMNFIGTKANIIDSNDNLWIGQGDLICSLRDGGGDSLFADISYDHYTTEADEKLIHVFRSKSVTKISIDHRLISY